MKKKIEVDLSKLMGEPAIPNAPDKYHVKDFKVVIHMNMVNEGILVHSGTIECKNRIDVHGKELILEVITLKNKASGNWGTGKAYFHIGEGQVFETIAELNAHYNLVLEAEAKP